MRRVLPYGLVLAGAAMIPWLFILAAMLPEHTQVDHWSLAWVGLDGAEATGLAGTGLLLLSGRYDQARLAAAVTGTLLLVDAWFDTTTAISVADRLTAGLMAGLAEAPIAILCLSIAVRGLTASPVTSPDGLTADVTARCAPAVSAPAQPDPGQRQT
ncbi:MAG TPA: hypothetical protein VG756_18910 [Pseudonocardiaceae bacterium]|nr:hypothetical protein [Pseudonocardiaceae bacterium]